MGARTPRQNTDYRLETVDNEILLYHPVKTKTLYLNETVALIWRRGRRKSFERRDLRIARRGLSRRIRDDRR